MSHPEPSIPANVAEVRPAWRKLLHVMVILGLVHQVVVADWMSEPWEAAESAEELLFYTLHAVVGMTVGGLVLLLALSLVRTPGMASRLWPWPAAARAALWQSGRRLLGRRADAVDEERAAKAWQGFGLLIMLTLSGTGTAIYLLDPRHDLMKAIAEVHEGAVSLLWVYLAGHVGMTVWHALQGRHLWRDMFGLRSRG
ncbi:cytochrome b/b6 domain-containing protein [Perlucidibaca piscinae]|uniref:cytochrome b/b6 domain-containing protein n=1 Tax=Perlucidibaca piscinae TaxID=392589 RepID=UPI0003B37503|nr:cytochrome b/b6 domain-containing protein [Perlucidibaca piscinae]